MCRPLMGPAWVYEYQLNVSVKHPGSHPMGYNQTDSDNWTSPSRLVPVHDNLDTPR